MAATEGCAGRTVVATGACVRGRDPAAADRLAEAARTAALQGITVRRAGTPAGVAQAVPFLAGDGAGRITGRTIGAGGGKRPPTHHDTAIVAAPR